MNSDKKFNGFSLIELSISIAIISIIIGIVTSAVVLERQAKLKTIASELVTVENAYNLFKIQYNALPGDIRNATTLWPAPTVTANGNGNNRIGSSFNGSSSGEDIYLFQHLSLSGMLPYNYVGGIQAPAYYYTLGKNIFASKISGLGISILYANNYQITSNLIEFGSLTTDSCAGHSNGSAISGTEAYQIDLKIDDGLPYSGRLHINRGCAQASNPVCVNLVGGVATTFIPGSDPKCFLKWELVS